jgi:transcriptional regulator
MTNVHLEQYEPGGSIYVSRGVKYRDIISKLFPQCDTRGLRIKYDGTLVLYTMTANGIFN